MGLFHVEDTPLFLIHVGSVDDDGFKLVQFERSCCFTVSLVLFFEFRGVGGGLVPESIRSDIRAGVPAPMATLFVVVSVMGSL